MGHVLTSCQMVDNQIFPHARNYQEMAHETN